jgi:hypothetical protein
MAAAPADMGFGHALTFSSSFFGYVRVTSVNNIAREAIETTHSGSANGTRTYIPSDLEDCGEVQIEGLLDHNTTPPIASAAESFTLTFPLATGETVAANWAGSAFMTSFSASVPYDGVCTFTATLKFAGAITCTAAT